MKTRAFALFLLTLPFHSPAQETKLLTPDQKALIDKRWEVHQPVAEVILKNGDTIQGQPLHFDLDTLVIYPSVKLPLAFGDELIIIPLGDIDRVVMNRGGRNTQALTMGIVVGVTAGIVGGMALWGPTGALILGNVGGVGLGQIGKSIHRNQTYAELELKSYNLNFREELTKLHNWSVFEDSLILTDDQQLLPVHSRAVRRVFHPKKFRISFAVSMGFKNLEEEIQELFTSSGLPIYRYGGHSTLGFEFMDLSYRFNNRWNIGVGLLVNRDDLVYADYYTYEYPVFGLEGYSYSVQPFDTRVYMEYVLWPVNWFPAKRTELQLGAGIMVSRAQTNIGFNYVSDTISGYPDFYGSNEIHTLFGALLRASFHVYPAQGISFSLGMEGNLYQNLKMPATGLPDTYPPLPNEFPAHTLNYSTIRVKLGVHIYL